MRKKYIALDIGGSGGRASLGEYDGSTIRVNPLYEFSYNHVEIHGTPYWNALAIIQGVYDSLASASQLIGNNACSIGIDTMGVNFGLLDSDDELISNPFYTRIPQDSKVNKYIFEKIDPDSLYSITGLQTSKLNALYYLAKMQMTGAPALEQVRTFLMLPDLLNFWLTGNKAAEYTISSTSYLLNATTQNWSRELLDICSLNDIFPDIVPAGTVIGSLSHNVKRLTGLSSAAVVATASHDTAAAISVVPNTENLCAYISSGTWGMLGMDIKDPILTEEAKRNNFANEGGAFGNIRFIHNSVNLWILKECNKIWQKKGLEYPWDQLSELAQHERAFTAFIDPQNPKFLLSHNMLETMQSVCIEYGFEPPQTLGSFVRVLYESLALKYRYTFDRMCETSNKRPKVLHIIGGGGQDILLNQFIANAIGIPVISGPNNATVLGNIIFQMKADGEISSKDEVKEIIKNSCELITWYPEDTVLWKEQYERYLSFLNT